MAQAQDDLNSAGGSGMISSAGTASDYTDSSSPSSAFSRKD
jgi:hypothetical protein